MKKAIYPGSFDPMHKGHIEIIKKAAKLFDELIVVVTNNLEKKPNTSIKKRYEDAKKEISIENVKVILNEDNLTVNIARNNNAKWIVRSGRDNIDFKYELELAAANKFLADEIETVLLMPDLDSIDYRSRIIKQGVT